MTSTSIQSSTTITTKITINMQIQNKRLDLVSRESLPVEELTRFTIKDGKIILPALSYEGRGYYIKKGSIEMAIKRKVFERLLKRSLTVEEKESLLNYER